MKYFSQYLGYQQKFLTILNFKTIELIGGKNSMVKYKVNLKFKENGKSLNEIVTNVLRIELEKNIFMTSKNSKIDVSTEYIRDSQSERSRN